MVPLYPERTSFTVSRPTSSYTFYCEYSGENTLLNANTIFSDAITTLVSLTIYKHSSPNPLALSSFSAELQGRTRTNILMLLTDFEAAGVIETLL